MAATATDYAKLQAEELRDKLGEFKDTINNLAELSDRNAEQDADLVDALDQAEQITAALAKKNQEETQRRIANLRKFDDKPRERKTGGSAPAVENFSCLGERYAAIARARITGQIDPRLRNALGANEGTPSDGGFFVGSDSETDLQSKVYGESSILSRVQRTSISSASNMLKLKLLKETSRADGSRQGAVRGYWEGEADSTTASQREYEELELTLKKLMALSYATSELLEDYSALESELNAGYQEEMTFKLENAIIRGDGVGKPLGIINSPAKVTVSAETGQSTDTPIMFENVAKMWARLHPRSQMNSIFLVDQTLIPYLMQMTISAGTGGAPVYIPPSGLSSEPYGTIFGRPVIFTEHTYAKNTEGDIILWDPSSYRIIEKGGIRGASSLHVAFLTDETAFRYTYRVNGAPKWRSALTPYNSGDTLSTIVTLATRT